MADSDVVHADVAGWVLGALDPDESERFEAHLETCDECRQEVAELGPAAQMFKAILPGVDLASGPEPPADLQARTMARIQQASRKSRWRRGNLRTLAAAAAAVVAVAAAGIGFSLAQSTAALAFTIPLHHEPGKTGSGQAVAHQAPGGWSIQMNVEHLRPLRSNQFYECLYAGPDKQARSSSADPGRDLHRERQRQRQRPYVERRQPAQVPHHGDRHRAGRQPRPAGHGRPRRQSPSLTSPARDARPGAPGLAADPGAGAERSGSDGNGSGRRHQPARAASSQGMGQHHLGERRVRRAASGLRPRRSRVRSAEMILNCLAATSRMGGAGQQKGT